jgi:dihydrofolate synthase / folylpolyglutamate synthase
MTYQAAIDWLFSTQLFGIKLGLDGPRELLRQSLAFPPCGVRVIHVAGTNGKGSTCAFIDAIARAHGMRTGLFTSPHLIDYRERIKVAGADISEEDCTRHLIALREICEAMETHPTFFEITIAVALRYFAEKECELIVLETGMGGRLDATTAVPADVAVITPIGLDHMQWLGDTIAAIAGEKAGIIRAEKPVISAPQHEDAARVIAMQANEMRAPLRIIDEPLRGYALSLHGPHQPWNAALAVEALHAAGVALRTEELRHGLAHTDWPGRFEIMRREPPAIILDGAHNPHAAEVLVATWQEKFPQRRASLIFSAVSSKDVRGVLTLLAPLAERIFLCSVNSPRALSHAELLEAMPSDAPDAISCASLDQALAAARQCNDPILIAGSLYLVGQARALLLDETFQPSAQ